MAQNPIPLTYDPLVALAEDAADGALQRGERPGERDCAVGDGCDW